MNTDKDGSQDNGGLNDDNGFDLQRYIYEAVQAHLATEEGQREYNQWLDDQNNNKLGE